MNVPIESMLAIIWLHFFADFILQSDFIAINKSKRNDVMLLHVSLYSIPFLWFGWVYALVNGALHFITDWITSRVTSYLWKNDERHWFFVVIGLDQALHLTALVLSYNYLV